MGNELESPLRFGCLKCISIDSAILSIICSLKEFKTLKSCMPKPDPQVKMCSLTLDWSGLASKLPVREDLPKCSLALVLKHFMELPM